MPRGMERPSQLLQSNAGADEVDVARLPDELADLGLDLSGIAAGAVAFDITGKELGQCEFAHARAEVFLLGCESKFHYLTPTIEADVAEYRQVKAFGKAGIRPSNSGLPNLIRIKSRTDATLLCKIPSCLPTRILLLKVTN